MILTTHSPQLLDHFDVEQIRVVELADSETRIGFISAEQKEAIRDKLLEPGELLTVDPARMQLEARRMRRLILFVEGEGEADAVPALVKRLLDEKGRWYDIFLLDNAPFRVGSVDKLVKEDFRGWKRFLGASLKRPDVGGVLLLLDGDIEKVGGKEFCASEVARSLASGAMHVGAGKTFSVAVVFASQEYESWLIAGIASLAGRRLPDGRLIESDAKAPQGDLETSPRDAKGWLGTIVEGGYKPTRDQAALTRLVDLEVIRARKLRSFRRLESAVSSLREAIQYNRPTVSPSCPTES